MSDKIFAAYDIDSGTAAARPATPTVSNGRLYVYVATDTHVISVWDGAQWVSFAGAPSVATLPTRQILTAGTAATYTTPAGCRQLRIRMIGGGGGASGANTGSATTTVGTDGTKSIFNAIEAAPGKGAPNNGAGGAISGTGAGAADLRIKGQGGRSGNQVAVAGTGVLGGWGGANPIGFGADQNAAAAANSGGGGGGGSSGATLGTQAGGGGGGAEYVELIINNPAATYTYTVGAKGTGGSGTGNPGSDGGTGEIIVDEFY